MQTLLILWRQSVSQHKEQLGFVTFAVNTPETNYLEIAYLQALNVKATQTNNKYAVIVDANTAQLVEEKHRNVFDYIIECTPTKNPFGVEPQVAYLTPFKETIKLESDLLFTRSIDHWINAFRLKDVCLSSGAKTYLGQAGTVRKYRELLDKNNLPDVYNGLMYFRYTQTAIDFFRLADLLFQNWDDVKLSLKNCDDDASTDVVYSLAAQIMGTDLVTMPGIDFLNFVHMKAGFQGWSDARSWLDTVITERDGDMIRVNNLNQYFPVHYQDKNYATQELIKYYESRRTSILE